MGYPLIARQLPRAARCKRIVMMSKPVSAALALTILAVQLGIASPALANSAMPNPTVVKFTDLDLDSAAGKSTLEGRIRNAANRICAAEQLTGSRIPSRACMAGIRQQVWAKVEDYQIRVGKGG